MWHEWSTLEKLIWLRRRIGGGASWVWQTITGSAPLTLANAVSHAIHSLTQYGLCTQASTPTPSDPVDIVCNNGVLTKPHDTYTAVDGQGTYVTPGTAANRIYKALSVGDGNYTISVPTAYDFIVQYKTPAEGSLPTDYGNVGTWVNGTETVTLDKGTAYGYGIALRDHVNQSGSISPSDFSGNIVVVHDDEPVEAVGTPEVLTVGATGAETQTVTDIPMLLSVGDYADEAEIISGIKTGKVGIKVFDGTETVNVSSAGNAYIAIDGVAIGAPNTPIDTHFALETSTTSLAEGCARFGAKGSTIYSSNYYMSHPTARTAADFKAWLASEYAAGSPVIVVYPIAESTTEQGTPHALHTSAGDNVVDVTANVSPVEMEVEYASNN